MQDWAAIYSFMTDDIAASNGNSIFIVIFGLVIVTMSIIVGTLNTKSRRKKGLSTWVAIVPMVPVFIIGVGYSVYGYLESNAQPVALNARFIGCEPGGHGTVHMTLEIRKSLKFYSDGHTSRGSTLGFHTRQTTEELCETLPKDAVETFICTPDKKCVGWLADGQLKREGYNQP